MLDSKMRGKEGKFWNEKIGGITDVRLWCEWVETVIVSFKVGSDEIL